MTRALGAADRAISRGSAASEGLWGAAAVGALVVLHFVCPLLFFTDLTRNPYVTQIALLNASLLFIAAAWALREAAGDAWTLTLPRTPLDLPLAAWAGVCLLSWILAYFGHLPFFRPAMRSEGARALLFTAVNAMLPFYVAARQAAECPAEPDAPVGAWVVFALVWGGLWALFPQTRGGAGSPLSVWDHVWNPYGALLWAGGLVAAFRLVRRGRVHDFWHLALAAGFLASVYGVLQYFNVEMIWPKVLNPYGGRAVSTFGNPNFMSSYMVLLAPVAAAYYLQARAPARRAVYAAVLLAFEACLLCSLTRSSWIGALAGLGVLFLSPELRRRAAADLETHGLVFSAAVAMVLFWPQSAVTGSTPSVLGRMQELSLALDTKGPNPYSPLYQRVLIWSCAWLMGRENWLLGKGWGNFELFYPFYQGHMLSQFDFFKTMRTHANNSHNEILETFSQTGLAGVGVLVWIWTAFFRSSWTWARHRLEEEPAWMTAAAAGVAGMLVDNLLNVSLHFAVPAFLFWWQAGTAMGRAQGGLLGPRRLTLPHRALALALAGLVGAGAVGGARLWWRIWNREVHYFMGFKLARGERWAGAIDELGAAHRRHDREVNCNYELGNAYAKTQNWEKALWGYDEAMKANAGYDEIYFNRATVLGRLGREEEALRNFQVAQFINPLSYELYTNMSQLLLKPPVRHREEAIGLLEQALRHFPDDPNFLNNLGYLRALGDEYPQAVDAWSKALRVNPDLAQARKNLEAAQVRGGIAPPPILGEVARLAELEARIGRRDYSAATLELSRKVHASFPKLTKAAFYRGNLELIAGDARTAVSLLEPLAKADPRHAALLLNLGQAYLKLGRTAEAGAALRQVLNLDPNNAAAKTLLSRLGQ